MLGALADEFVEVVVELELESTQIRKQLEALQDWVRTLRGG